MNDDNGGGPRGSSERLAPVIPLFGGGNGGDTRAEATSPVPESHGGSAPEMRKVEALDLRAEGTPSDRHPARSGRTRPAASQLHALDSEGRDLPDEVPGPDPDELRVAAEEALVRKLRARSLSVSEARQILRGRALDGSQIEDVIDDFCRRSYLDDVALAQSLVTSGAERKGQGRVALSRSLAQRGIPREIIAGALDELPDDDAERALDFARTKARSLARLDNDTALRRLMGQLSRRGYNGSVAMRAAKAALAEASFGGRPSGVHFVESD